MTRTKIQRYKLQRRACLVHGTFGGGGGGFPEEVLPEVRFEGLFIHSLTHSKQNLLGTCYLIGTVAETKGIKIDRSLS